MLTIAGGIIIAALVLANFELCLLILGCVALLALGLGAVLLCIAFPWMLVFPMLALGSYVSNRGKI